MTRTRSTLVTLLALVGLLVLAGSASAKDRNHDGLPDRWEKRHHLSLNVKQARRDQDHDGLRNKAEWRASTDPRNADSDDDGIEDGNENAGQVISFENGVLKLSVFGSDPLVGQVTDQTEIDCEELAMAKASHDGPGDDSGDDQGDDHGGDRGDGEHGDDQGDDHGDDHGDGDHQDDDGFDEQSCGTDQLKPGVKVVEAELEVRNGQAIFTQLELHP